MTHENAGWNLDNSYTQLPETFYSKLELNPVQSPELVIFNHFLAKQLGLDAEDLLKEEGIKVFAGNEFPEDSIPIAQAYAGHQFGHFTMLGDGRALLIGEHITPSGKRYDIQLKGSGRTPYSRGGDGRASLGPMLREYIISEAMHALGIPTSRSLAVVTTGQAVIRETELPGAILTRVASSHLRFGTFQYARKWASKEELKALADYAIDRHYPEIEASDKPYLSLLKEVTKRQAEIVAKWQLVGFIHGVMNTDNMTISGETIDYGPCAFMDKYDPETVFSSIDMNGRYAYRNQPPIMNWNLARFAETMLPLLDDDSDQAVEIAEGVIAKFPEYYNHHWIAGMRAKLGLFNEEKEDETLVKNLLDLMEKYSTDFTNTFRALTIEKYEGGLFDSEEFNSWHEQWQSRLGRQEESKETSHQLMRDHNPAVIPRNHRVEEAIEAAVENEDYSTLDDLLDVLERPYEHSLNQEKYATPPEPSNKVYQTFCGT